MNIVRCNKGHSYDADKHSSCPYCGVDIENFSLNKTQPLNQQINSGMNQHTQPLDNNIQAPFVETNHTEALSEFINKQKNSDKTAALYTNKTTNIDPVVGWLVAINGNNKGKDYPIRSGGNSIGRNTSNSIILTDDETISRDRHAEITYDPLGNGFYIIPGTGRGLAYLNNNIILMPQTINEYDIIKIGHTELIFKSLCCDKFKWNDNAEN